MWSSGSSSGCEIAVEPGQFSGLPGVPVGRGGEPGIAGGAVSAPEVAPLADVHGRRVRGCGVSVPGLAGEPECLQGGGVATAAAGPVAAEAEGVRPGAEPENG